jgi:hypothetical protein
MVRNKMKEQFIELKDMAGLSNKKITGNCTGYNEILSIPR